jgi:hypothetical protein
MHLKLWVVVVVVGVVVVVVEAIYILDGANDVVIKNSNYV